MCGISAHGHLNPCSGQQVAKTLETFVVEGEPRPHNSLEPPPVPDHPSRSMSSAASTRTQVTRLLLRLAIAGGLLTLLVFGQSGPAAAPEQRRPVLVELFTSEGCSDCPPADALLAQLDATQFVPGADAIVLSEHVTYWNHEGWNDPFSMPAMDERQQDYVSRFRLQGSYTPQVVVDGAFQAVGNSTAAVAQAVAQAAEAPKEPLAIENAHWADGAAEFTVRGATSGAAALMVALAANGTRSEVARGENAGRTLHHVAVVRVLKDFGAGATDGRALRLSSRSLAHGDEAAGSVRLVAFLVDRKTGHVLAVAEQTLDRAP